MEPILPFPKTEPKSLVKLAETVAQRRALAVLNARLEEINNVLHALDNMDLATAQDLVGLRQAELLEAMKRLEEV